MSDSQTDPAKSSASAGEQEIVRPPVNGWFRALVPAAGVFLVTIFFSIAAMFNDPDGAATQLFDRWGILILSCEVAVILVLVVVAMAVDRRQILQGQQQEEFPANGAGVPSSGTEKN